MLHHLHALFRFKKAVFEFDALYDCCNSLSLHKARIILMKHVLTFWFFLYKKERKKERNDTFSAEQMDSKLSTTVGQES